jgi:hypothetical protein
VDEEKLLDLAFQVVAAEENARLVAERLAGRVQVEVAPSPPVVSRVVRSVDVKIPATLIDEYGSGCLKEFLVKSTGKNYVLRVYVDGSELYHNSFSWFQDISQEVEEIDAFEEDGVYVLRLGDINFAKHVKIMAEPSVSTQATSRLEEVFAKVNVAKG